MDTLRWCRGGLRYVLRPPIAQDKLQPQQGGLIRIVLKRPFADGTVAD
jgi:hypothetical protein